jgi:predicted MFS family arabinose efflux permease
MLFIAPISALFGIGLLAKQGLSIGVSGVATVVLLTRESPAGRATTLTLNVAAMSLGSALGGLLLAVTGFWLIGFGAFLPGFLSAMLVWWYQDRSNVALPSPAPEAPT